MTFPNRPQAEARSAYKVFRPISTRWMDNDLYGHVNNVVYYSWFDTAVNGYLIEAGAIDIHGGSVIGLVIETQCNYFSPLTFPDPVLAGVRVDMWARPACVMRSGCSLARPVSAVSQLRN